MAIASNLKPIPLSDRIHCYSLNRNLDSGQSAYS